jgi:hypothetical protein
VKLLEYTHTDQGNTTKALSPKRLVIVFMACRLVCRHQVCRGQFDAILARLFPTHLSAPFRIVVCGFCRQCPVLSWSAAANDDIIKSSVSLGLVTQTEGPFLPAPPRLRGLCARSLPSRVRRHDRRPSDSAATRCDSACGQIEIGGAARRPASTESAALLLLAICGGGPEAASLAPASAALHWNMAARGSLGECVAGA